MKIIGIDLSLRSTGLVCVDNSNFDYKLIVTDPKKLNDEELIAYNWTLIELFITKHNPTHIAIEGLSFNSLSSSKDLLAGNFWYIRTRLFASYPEIKVDIIPVLTWRSPLFNKEERKSLKECDKKVKDLKKLMKTMTKDQKAECAIENKEIIQGANIKYLTWMKLPDIIKSEFHKVGFTKGGFDLTDAYFLAKHMEKQYA
jgi:hypothetical protein